MFNCEITVTIIHADDDHGPDQYFNPYEVRHAIATIETILPFVPSTGIEMYIEGDPVLLDRVIWHDDREVFECQSQFTLEGETLEEYGKPCNDSRWSFRIVEPDT